MACGSVISYLAHTRSMVSTSQMYFAGNFGAPAQPLIIAIKKVNSTTSAISTSDGVPVGLCILLIASTPLPISLSPL